MIKNTLILSVLIACSASQAMQQNNKYLYKNYEQRTPDKELIAKYTASQEFLKKAESERYQSLFTSKREAYLYKFTDAISRLRGSLLIRECACAYNLDAISSPEKYFTSTTGNCVIVRGIPGNRKPFSLKQIQQLFVITTETGYIDIQNPNIFNTDEGIAYLIDTEQRSFHQFSSTPVHIPLVTLTNLKHLHIETAANAWIDHKIEEITNNSDSNI